MNKLPQILYVMGTGRSGTTIMDILLSDNPRFLGAGEITHVFQDGIIDQKLCSCGQTMADCMVWGRVFTEMGTETPADMVKLMRSMEAHITFPLVALRLLKRKKQQLYASINRRLFCRLADSDFDVVIDSSKYAGRGLLLARFFPQNVRVICVTRSPAGLINSFQKQDTEQPPKSLIATFAYYLYALACFSYCRLFLGKNFIPVKYEDMVSDPIGVLERIENRSGLDCSRSKDCLRNDDDLQVGHIITGNRIRKQGKVKFQKGGSVPVLAGPARLVAGVMNIYGRILRF